jgi:hypothetical protein
LHGEDARVSDVDQSYLEVAGKGPGSGLLLEGGCIEGGEPREEHPVELVHEWRLSALLKLMFNFVFDHF